MVQDCSNPFAPIWRYFRALRLWKNEPPKHKYHPLKTKIKRIGRRILERLNLIEPRPEIPCPQEARLSSQRLHDELIAEDRAKGLLQ